MKLKIEYKYQDDGSGAPFWAYTTWEKQYFCACGGSYESAKQQLIKRIILLVKSREVRPPAPEEVEIEVGEASYANQG